MSVEIVFETHSLTVDNETGIATGWRDGRLSGRGRALAVELGERRRDDGIAAVFTSDLAARSRRPTWPSVTPAFPCTVTPGCASVTTGSGTGSRSPGWR